MAHLHLYKEGTIGGQDGIEILPGDNILAEILAPTYIGASSTTFGLYVRCETGYTVPQLIVKAVRDPAAAPFGGKITLSAPTVTTEAAVMPMEGGLGGGIASGTYYSYGDTYPIPITSIEQAATYVGGGGELYATLTDINTTNKLFILTAFGVALEAGNYQDWSLNFSFTELAV